MTDDSASRKAFEEWQRSPEHYYAPDEWRAWQASRAAALAESAKALEELGAAKKYLIRMGVWNDDPSVCAMLISFSIAARDFNENHGQRVILSLCAVIKNVRPALAAIRAGRKGEG